MCSKLVCVGVHVMYVRQRTCVYVRVCVCVCVGGGGGLTETARIAPYTGRIDALRRESREKRVENEIRREGREGGREGGREREREREGGKRWM